MSSHRAFIGGFSALLMSASLLTTAHAVSVSAHPTDEATASTYRYDDDPPRQRVKLVVTRPVRRDGSRAAKAAMTAKIKPVRPGRPVLLQVKRKRGWKKDGWMTVDRKRSRAASVRFEARAISRRGKVLRYRVAALPYRGLDRVRSASVRGTTTSATTVTTPTLTTLSNSPAQPAAIVYDESAGASAYARPGGLVIAGRDNYQDQAFKSISAAGGTTLIYVDPIIDNSYGRYHELLIGSSACGPATSRWPGSYRANDYGYLSDFRVGSVLQNKLECVLETMVAENPHMGGWFVDDLGSRSWFPGFSWGSFPDKQAYRDGAIALTQTFREVADRHGLIFLVNGTWSAGDGGGYPDADRHGNALADGGFVEHHDGQIGYFGPYACSDQWAAQSPVTRGTAFHYAVTSSPSGTAEYAGSGCYAFVNQQDDYGTTPPPWGAFRPTGLPSRVTR